MRSLILCAAAIVLLSASVATTPQQKTRTIFVSAIANKLPVTDLTAADFVVKENGAVREIATAQVATVPMSIALMLDNGGMALGAIRQGAGQFIEALQGRAEFAIFTISVRKLTLVDFTKDIPSLYEGLKTLLARNTNSVDLLDAFVDVSKAFSREAPRGPSSWPWRRKAKK